MGKNSKDWGKPPKRASNCQSEVRGDTGVVRLTSPQRCSRRLEPRDALALARNKGEIQKEASVSFLL